MNRLFNLLCFLLLGLPAFAQLPYINNNLPIPSYTVAQLPTIAPTGASAYATDASGASCTSGGSSTVVLCRYNGSAWAPVTGASAGGGTFTDVNGTPNQITSSASTGPATTLSIPSTFTFPGTVTNDLSIFGATTSAQLRGVLNDESGTGAALFAGGNIGAATGTSLALNASGAYAEAAPLQIQVNGSGVGFLVQNTTSDYTDFISGGALKGMRGTGTTPAIWTNGTNWSTPASIISFGGGNALGTTGTMFGVNIGGSSNAPLLFNPSSGTQKFVALNVGPQIAQTSTASGDYTALQVNVTETGVLGTNKLLADFQVGSTSKFKVDDTGNTTSTLYSTATNCSNAATPAVCAAAPSGVVAVPTGTNPTLTINTTAVTANSRIFLQIDESATIAATTCNTTLSTLIQPVVTARTAATSFTIQIGAIIATNPACVSYFLVN